ncbi:HEAT repeat domain-containing protein [Streptomyces neyagawaensis]|uniref:HEAT repeat domain-containing protein n=2 Tax=Streptomyces neyagawaensis TaxID=42238 RepID=UPI00237E2EFB|nr:HEAT repeat domain-containing protein [Streptomyces neyagawaensis]MDE1682605.1 HEAT repeat domain-containing protein [Streptomyces neyagawaensis]
MSEGWKSIDRAELEAVDWAGLKHNYGTAEDVPELLRRCAGSDPDDAEDAAFDLLNHLYHQGGWVCPAATAALPFVLRLAAAPQVTPRRTLLELVGRLAADAGMVEARFLDPHWSATWERHLPDVLALLADPQPEIRRAAADVIGACADPGDDALPALLSRWHAESDPVTRLDLVLALGNAVRRGPVGALSDEAAAPSDEAATPSYEAAALLDSLLAAPEPQLRLAAVLALGDGPRASAAASAEGRLEIALGALRDPSVELWQRTSAGECGARGMHQWTASLFDDASPAFALGLMADHPDEEQRVGGLEQAARVLSRWRSPADALLPGVVARLDDPATEVRYRAAELLACLGPAATAHADAVAALLDDTAVRATRGGETVAEAAVWALARMDDPRCLPRLTEHVAGTRPGFASVGAYYGSSANSFHHPTLPALHEVLVRLPDHAEALLPGVCDRLSPTEDIRLLGRLGEVLAAWGPAAEPAVPRLLDLLADDERWPAAATALAGIGRAGRAGREALLARSRTGGPDAELAAWAYWRVGGDPGPALDVLGPAATDEDRATHTALSRLADLGPHAAGYADRLRELAAAEDDWGRTQAAHALWAVTGGDTETAVPALMETVRKLPTGTYLPAMLPAVRHLARMGEAAVPAARLLQDLPADDRRVHYFGGWRGFTEDESIRMAVDELLAGCSGA